MFKQGKQQIMVGQVGVVLFCLNLVQLNWNFLFCLKLLEMILIC